MNKSLFSGSIIVLVLVIISILSPLTIFAAIDPAIIQERHEEAPYHIRGKIISDELIEDVTTDDKHPEQLRKMKIQLDEIIKSQSELNSVVEIVYHYIPSWNSAEYVGGKRMDIVVNDVVEVWLDDSEHGLEPVLGGYSVHHIHYEENRLEHIPEPFWHGVVRKLGSVKELPLDLFIISGLIIVIGWAVFRGLKKFG
ncbi:hypothetical protein [Ornithinibacillus halotolerans]|uniref:Uncharacterized protein n=1 Tax=Ornithinibacillus halotolerans TaxID=1274357 RepID=A0A916WC61_9BACI|nr:hypothetical protein [Ornithinibacillus halotolerans]GGA85312.1 hypothetical protein GCM10008025_30430 [Ornithinibacillus halotolerans]